MKRRILSTITALALCLSLCPAWAFAAEPEADTGLCPHHPEHTAECGYIPPDSAEDSAYQPGADTELSGAPCTYVCSLCPIEDLIAALPRRVTADNAAEVQAQLDEILALCRELTGEEQAQIDLSRCYALQEALDAASVPAPLEEGAVKVETSDGTTTYYDDIKSAWDAARAAGIATVTLLADVSTNNFLFVFSGETITLTSEGDYTLSGSSACTIYVNEGSFILSGGTVENSSQAIRILKGTAQITGGTAVGTGTYGDGLCVSGSTAAVTISGGTLRGERYGLKVDNGTVEISGGTFQGGDKCIYIDSSKGTLGSLLKNCGTDNEPHYAYYNGDTLLMGILNDTSLSCPSATVGECTHGGDSEYTPNGDGTHTLICRACGGGIETAGCTCVLEGTVEGATAHLTEMCRFCGYTKALGDVTVTIPKLIYGETAGKKDEFKVETDIQFGSYQPAITIDGAEINDADFEQILAGLSAGEYVDRLGLRIYYPVDAGPGSRFFLIPFTIDPAPLTVTNATVQTKTYDGSDTAAITGVTFSGLAGGEALTPGTDYTVTGTFDSADAGTDKGVTVTVTLTGTAKASNYTISGAPFTARGTIEAASISAATVTLSQDNFTYTGAAHTPDPAVTLGGNTLVKDTDYTVSYANNTDAGTASVTITGKGNYSGAKTASFTIDPATLTAEGSGIAKGTYGDTLSGLTVEGLTAKLSGNTVGGTWKLSGDTIPDVGDAKKYDVTFTPATGADNYKPLTAQVTLEIAKAAAPATQTGTLNVQNGYERSYSFDLSRLLPALESGKKFGSVSYALGTVNITGGYYDGGDPATISGNTLTLPVQKVDAEDEGQIGTITVTISCSNFDNVDATIHVYRSNKEPVAIENVSAQNAAYDGKTHTGYTGSPTAGAYTGKFSVTYTGRNGTSYNSTEPPVNAGSYTVTIAVPDDNERFIGSIALDFTIAPKTLEWDTTKLTAAKKYDGTNSAAPVLGELAVSGALSGDTVVFRYTGITAPAFTSAEAHSENLTLTVTGAALTGADAANYALPGTGPVITAAIHAVATSEVSGNDELRLEVETGLSTVPDALKNNPELNTPEKIETALRTKVEEVLSNVGEQIVIFDVRLQYKDGNGQWRDVDPDDFPENGVTAILPYPAGTGATGYTFTVQHLISSGDKAGTMETLSYTLTPDGLQCRFTSLSPVAIGYQAATKPVPPPDSGGNYGGNYGGVSTYAVTVVKSEHGTVTSNRTNASSGTTVTLTVTPDSGYVLDTLTVTDSRGNEVKLTAQANGKYTFTMPSRAVTVTAAFAPIPGGAEKPCDGGADCPSRGFTDLGGVGTWYHEAVDYVLRNGLMGGYGNGLFGPNDTLSRAQLAQILYNKEGRPSVIGGSVFTDVPDGAWCADAITWAAQNGIVSGYGNGLFGPNDNITREQLAVMLWRYAGSPAATNKELHFTDADEISDYALNALRWAVENGVLNGYGDGQLGPKGQATRTQVAQMLKNYLGGE